MAGELSRTVKRRPRIFRAFIRFGDSSRSRKMPKTVPFYGQEGCLAKNFLPVKVKINGVRLSAFAVVRTRRKKVKKSSEKS